jgi:hypothetical protein
VALKGLEGMASIISLPDDLIEDTRVRLAAVEHVQPGPQLGYLPRLTCERDLFLKDVAFPSSIRNGGSLRTPAKLTAPISD